MKKASKKSGKATDISHNNSDEVQVSTAVPNVKNYYKKSDSGPFRAILSLKQIHNEQGERMRPPINLEVCRDLYRMGIVSSKNERCSRYKWEISFPSREAANDALNNKYLKNSKYVIDISWYFVYRRVVLFGIPSDIPRQEINDEILRSNKKLSIDEERTFRFQKRIQGNNGTTLADSSSVRITIRFSLPFLSILSYGTSESEQLLSFPLFAVVITVAS